MKRAPVWIPLLALLPAAAACHGGEAPPGGTYTLVTTGTRTLKTSESAQASTAPWSVDTTAAVYLDSSSSGGPVEDVFTQMGLSAPRRGRLFEMRLFPEVFRDDTSTGTLAGVFSDTTVEAVGQAWAGGNDVVITFEGAETPTFCAWYERYRLLYLTGTWAGESWDIALEATYTETCIDAGGTLVRDGYPRVEYVLEGTSALVFDPAPEADRPAPVDSPSALHLEDTLAEAHR